MGRFKRFQNCQVSRQVRLASVSNEFIVVPVDVRKYSLERGAQVVMRLCETEPEMFFIARSEGRAGTVAEIPLVVGCSCTRIDKVDRQWIWSCSGEAVEAGYDRVWRIDGEGGIGPTGVAACNRQGVSPR